jgi:adenylate cyclase
VRWPVPRRDEFQAHRHRRTKQIDTFFRCENGRLKLRDLGAGGNSYLIFYQRSDQTGPKQSAYETSPVPDLTSMLLLLAKAWGEGKTVRKKRTLFFIELEVCLKMEGTYVEMLA